MNKTSVFFAAVLALVLAGPVFQASAAGYDALLPLLVDLPGWEAEPADGADASAQGMRAVTAYRTYESGDRRFEVNLLYGTQAGMAWVPQYQEGYKMETSEGILEVKRIGGFLVFNTFENEDQSGGIMVLLRDGKDDPTTGAVLAISFEGLPLEEALKLAQRFSWAKMKDQVGKLK
jgi:hypothetical protein